MNRLGTETVVYAAFLCRSTATDFTDRIDMNLTSHRNKINRNETIRYADRGTSNDLR